MTGDLQASKVRQGLEQLFIEHGPIFDWDPENDQAIECDAGDWDGETAPTHAAHLADVILAWHLEQVAALLDESRDHIAQACGDPGSFVERNIDESVSRWSGRAVIAAIKQRAGMSS
jgi:hypothetical protein